MQFDFTEDASETFTPERPGYWNVVSDFGGGGDLGGGDLTIKQDGQAYTNFSGATTLARGTLYFRGGSEVTVALANSSSPTLSVHLERIPFTPFI